MSSARSTKATTKQLACAQVKGDTIIRRLSRGVYLTNNPDIPHQTVLRVTNKHAARTEATVLRHLAALGCSGVPRYCGRWSHAGLTCLRVEVVDGRSLENAFSVDNPEHVFCPRALVEVARCVAHKLRFLHRHNVVHLNVKPATAMVVNGAAKLVGWKHAQVLTAAAPPRAAHLTGLFSAPEARRGPVVANTKLDVWSFGATMFYIATGGVVPPLRAEQLSLPSMPLWFSNMVRDACAGDPEQRPTMAQLCDKYFSIKASPWSHSLIAEVERQAAQSSVAATSSEEDDAPILGDNEAENNLSHDNDSIDETSAEDELEFGRRRLGNPTTPKRPRTRASVSPALELPTDQHLAVTRTRASSCISAPNVLSGPRVTRCLRFLSADAGLAGHL